MSGRAVVQWQQEVDLANLEAMRADLHRATDSLTAGDTVVVDVSRVPYLDSLAIGLLVDARNRCLTAGLALVIAGMSDRSKRVLALSGLVSFFTFVDAVDAVGPAPSGAAAGTGAVDAATGSAVPARLPESTPTTNDPDPMFDQIAALVRRVLDVPTALVSFVDRTRQVFPGAVGLPGQWQEHRTTPLSHSFCQYVVASATPLVVSDATADPVLQHNGALPDLGVVAYAGIPLTDVDGRTVGSLCAIDSVAREWTRSELATLSDLAAACSAELQRRGALRRAELALERDRIARDLHQRVVGELFAVTMSLGQARSLTTGRADELVASAIDTIDGAITAIRNTVFEVARPALGEQ